MMCLDGDFGLMGFETALHCWSRELEASVVDELQHLHRPNGWKKSGTFN